jgi:DNA polymerase
LGPTGQYQWQLVQHQNQRGVGVDGELLPKILGCADARLATIQIELQQATGGAIQSTHQVGAIQKWLAENGCQLSNLQAPTLEEALKREDLSPIVHQVLALRAEAAHALKAPSLQRCRSLDGRVHDTAVFSAAGTGRLASHSPNLQNLHREEGDTLAKVLAVMTGDLAEVAKFGPVMQVLGSIESALICAEPGNQFFDGDWSGQESRGGAWLCGEIWKRDAWEERDHTGKREIEPYYQLGIKCGIIPELARDFGKALDLACQYGSGVARVKKQLIKTLNLSPDLDYTRFVQIWRSGNPRIVGFWKKLQSCAVAALRRPGSEIDCGKLTFRFDGTFLKMRLPSGRAISYPFAREGQGKYGDAVVIFKDAQQGKFEDCNHGHGFWGGALLENAVQGIGADILMEAVVRLEEADYPVVLTIHDQVIVELPKNKGSLDEFRYLVEQRPTWGPDLPLAVKVRCGPRLADIDLPVTTWVPGSWDTVPLYTAQHKIKTPRPKAPRKPSPAKVKPLHILPGEPLQIRGGPSPRRYAIPQSKTLQCSRRSRPRCHAGMDNPRQLKSSNQVNSPLKRALTSSRPWNCPTIRRQHNVRARNSPMFPTKRRTPLHQRQPANRQMETAPITVKMMRSMQAARSPRPSRTRTPKNMPTSPSMTSSYCARATGSHAYSITRSPTARCSTNRTVTS